MNGGFEDYENCPAFLGQVDGSLTDWYRTGLGSTDYHALCGWSGHAPRTGEGHLGMIPFDSSPEYREYATGRLPQPLSAGQTYRLEFWVILSEGRLHAIQEMSAYFSAAPPSWTGSAPPAGIVPQVVHSGGTFEDKVEWMRVSETFEAAAGEQYITLGNFFADADTTSVFFGCCGQHGAYYHVDDVSLVLESSQPSTTVTRALLDDRCSEEGALDGNGALDFGEEVDFEITVENTGGLDLSGWTAQLEVLGAEWVDPIDGRLSIASLDAGELVLLPVTLRIPSEAEGASCGQPIDLALREQAADGASAFRMTSSRTAMPCSTVAGTALRFVCTGPT